MNMKTDKKKIMLVFGTRPEAIKMCPLVLELKRQNRDFEAVVVVTGQHREMLDQILDCFKVHADYDLNIMKEGQTLFEITRGIIEGMREIYEIEKPALVLVHGDTTTAFASALTAYYMNIPVGHVEAGLRTYDNQSPYPEEFNRQAIGSIAALHFAPTQRTVQNLLDEHKPRGQIFLTGNTVIDALSTTVKKDYQHPALSWAEGSRLALLTAHRRENLDRLPEMFRAIRRVLDAHPDVKLIYPVHKNPRVRRAAQDAFGEHPRVKLLEPLDALMFHNIMARCYLILTDSGGIQEEAPALGKPVLVLRDTTERPEGVEAGVLRLVGTGEEQIFQAFSQLLDDSEEYERMRHAAYPYGDGTACVQIVEAIRQVLEA